MPAKHVQMRSANTLSVLEHIRTHGASTRREIEYATGLSWAAVSTISAELIDREVLYELPPQTKVAGRNPGSLDFIPMRNLTIGLELNAEGLSVLLFDLRCTVLDSRVEPLVSNRRDDVIAQTLAAVEAIISANKLYPADLLGIGIAMQGSVDKDGTTSLYNSFFLDWRNVPLKEIFESHFHVPALVMHDPVCIALAEQWSRKYSAEDEFAVVRLSYGIGMCYIAHGKPITGNEGIAGEFGHTVLNPYGPKCSCGNNGCLECYSSIRGLCHRILDAHRDGQIDLPATLREADDSDTEKMNRVVSWGAQQARNGNEVLKQLFSDVGTYLGAGLANIVSLFNPKYLILTGNLLDYRDLFLRSAEEWVRKIAWSFSDYTLLLSEGGRQTAATGAALHHINNAFVSLSSRLLSQAEYA